MCILSIDITQKIVYNINVKSREPISTPPKERWQHGETATTNHWRESTMKNVNTIHDQIAANREQWFQYIHKIKTNLATLETLYAAQIDNTPAQTVAAYVQEVGYDAAVEVIASLVNRSAWDGRISHRSAEWANAQENSWNEEACSRLSIYTNRIHMVHLNQIAQALIEYQPATMEDIITQK